MTSLIISVSLLLSGTLAAAAAPVTEQASAEDSRAECVILLHGLWRTALSMKALEWNLSDDGYTVVNITYPSILQSIEDLAPGAINRGISECRESGAGPINFVTHSLGGILVRQYLSNHEILELRRVVMLGPPNQGSEVADWVESKELLEVLAPQAVAQLSKGEESVPLKLGPVDFELGVIAGTVNRRAALPGIPLLPSDGTVTVAETQIDGMTDFVMIPTSHSFMMWNSAVIYQVGYFLRHGAFDHEHEGLTD
jgi:hypothetical protein